MPNVATHRTEESKREQNVDQTEAPSHGPTGSHPSLTAFGKEAAVDETLRNQENKKTDTTHPPPERRVVIRFPSDAVLFLEVQEVLSSLPPLLKIAPQVGGVPLLGVLELGERLLRNTLQCAGKQRMVKLSQTFVDFRQPLVSKLDRLVLLLGDELADLGLPLVLDRVKHRAIPFAKLPAQRLGFKFSPQVLQMKIREHVHRWTSPSVGHSPRAAIPNSECTLMSGKRWSLHG